MVNSFVSQIESPMGMIGTRRARQDDMRGIYNCLRQMVTFIPDSSEWPSLGRRFFEQQCVSAFVAESSDQGGRQQIVGYASVCFETKVRGGTIGHVEDVVVDSKFRRGGVGLMLVRALQSEARMRGAYKLYLECSDENTRFYSAAGFDRTGVSMSWRVS